MTEPVPEPEAEGGTGVFMYPTGAKYEGSWIWAEKDWEEKEKEPVEEVAAPAKGKAPPPKKGEAPPEEKTEEKVKVKMRHGQGVMVDNDNIYEGEWDHDCMEGNGLFKFAGGASYDGEWKKNVFQGKGKYTWPSGAYYIGEFDNNKMHGDGSYYDEEGRKWTGKFYNGAGPGLHTL
eukprot:CAMPEP_0175840884 /NCGR_PEP_ID=MMETSP0107_2-20121207/19617_1 /TAXON_ID=195067 ORGANISM="Goniomonas pacifica, Strain CCMP1869" /NCGR_SAMPLE_ID=MMETSP0107_2 /ASSEMBLY_ACC=CAM_ASM_000203 /LENGTH=175 /DNA_ID=CAMNT_0017154781 /DNA_START=8 /DNA_END=535 /DNA_ORIENTATION=-